MFDIRAFAQRAHGPVGAISAQFAQALTSFALGIAAARSLGAEGLGVFGLVYGGLVLAGALTSGLVGDSLTVLDRSDARTRAGLQVVAVGAAILTALVAAFLCRVTGLLTVTETVAMAVGFGLFVIEEQFRRLLMATLRFWRVFVVDAVCFVITLAWIGGAVVADRMTLTTLFTAIVVAQAGGIVAATLLLPSVERHFAPLRHADVVGVLRFGSWRAGPQAVRPATLAAMRVLVVAAVGTAIFGELEAARVYTAPALLLVHGVGAFLFASYAAQRERPYAALVRRADKVAGLLLVGVMGVGIVAAALTPLLGPLITGDNFEIQRLAVLSWMIYAAVMGSVLPYGGLASVTGLHVSVFNLRMIEAAISLAAVAALLFVFDASENWAPCALALGTAVYGLITRQFFLIPRTRRAVPAEDPSYPRVDE